MGEPESDSVIDGGVLRLRIIIGVLIAGCLGLAGMAIVLRGQGIFGPGPALPIISLIALVQALATLAMRPVVLSQMLRAREQRLAASESDSDTAWIQVYTTHTIVGAALFEGSAFSCLSLICWKENGGHSPAACSWSCSLRHGIFRSKRRSSGWIEEQREAVRNASD